MLSPNHGWEKCTKTLKVMERHQNIKVIEISQGRKIFKMLVILVIVLFIVIGGTTTKHAKKYSKTLKRVRQIRSLIFSNILKNAWK